MVLMGFKFNGLYNPESDIWVGPDLGETKADNLDLGKILEHDANVGSEPCFPAHQGNVSYPPAR